MKDFMGINAHTVQFPTELYAPLCRLVRDYHNFDWDINDNSANASAGKLTLSVSLKGIKWRDRANAGVQPDHPYGFVDWEKIYGGWKAAGFEIDACTEIGFPLRSLRLGERTNPDPNELVFPASYRRRETMV